MKNYNWCDYYDVEKWIVEDNLTAMSYDETPREIHYVKVNIGKFYQVKRTDEGFKQTCSPIIRWITLKEYQYLVSKEGVVVF